MIYTPFLFALCLWLARGVFGADADEVKSVSVMEGDSVTLYTHLTHIQTDIQTDLTELQTDIQILWTFKLNTRLAEIIKREQMNISFVSKDGIFRDHLQMDNQTGSLTITNIRTEHTGLYQLMIGSDKISYTSFTVMVHARLSVPVISRNSSQCSSSERSSVSKCVLLCSVLNVSHVSLSWYKGNSLLSSISVSDLNIRLSLPLEVEYQDTNTYRCVVSNPLSNQTQHLHINELCGSCSAHMQNPHLVGITVFLVMLVVATAALGVMCFFYNRKTRHRVQTRDEEDIHYAETTFCARQREISKAGDHIVYSSVALS